jgi:hypothetical protein
MDYTPLLLMDYTPLLEDIILRLAMLQDILKANLYVLVVVSVLLVVNIFSVVFRNGDY